MHLHPQPCQPQRTEPARPGGAEHIAAEGQRQRAETDTKLAAVQVSAGPAAVLSQLQTPSAAGGQLQTEVLSSNALPGGILR